MTEIIIPWREAFAVAFNDMAQAVHANAVDKGWWDEDRNDGEMLMLMVTELAEACEALRHGNPPDSHIPEFSGVEAELADVVIRAMDFCAARGYDLGDAIVAKHRYNQTRAIKHGGKIF